MSLVFDMESVSLLIRVINFVLIGLLGLEYASLKKMENS